ncbi:ATP-binding protein [Natronobiforma cellulositropha]|uniref:ATP-binding protein n=1 Tax=Natronobiforma cellulositropha TaxID=1679076 RepID=UPI0021D58F73|nr:ATP-binding protein [Natronobiforma cellulositropha]
MTDARSILYVAASEETAQRGADALERAADTMGETAGGIAGARPVSLTVEWATDFVTIRERAPTVDCVVFAETPTTAAGAHLLEVIDACQSTPLVLYTDSAYGPRTARSTDGVDGYVRQGEGTVSHLLDEVIWVCEGTTADATGEPLEEDFGWLPEGVFVVDERQHLTYANEWVGRLLGVDAAHVRNVPLAALSAGGTLSEEDFEALSDALERVLEEGAEVATLAVTVATDEGETPLTLRAGSRGDDAIVTVRPAADLEAVGTAPDEDERSRLGSLLAFATETAPSIEDERDGWQRAALLERALETSSDLVDGDRYVLFEREGDDLRVRSSTPDERASEGGGAEDERALELARRALRSGEAILAGTADEAGDEREPTTGSYLCVPVGSDAVLGVVAEGDGPLEASDREALAVLGQVAGDALAHRETIETATRAAGGKAVFEHGPEPLVRYEWHEGEAVVNEVNRAFEALFGCDGEALVGDPIEALVGPPLAADGSTTAEFEALLRGDDDHLVCRRETRDGVRAFVLFAIALERTDAGRIRHGVVQFADVTERVRTERALGALRERLEGFATLTERDLQPQLNVARGFLELASETGDEDHFAEVDDAHSRLASTLEEMRALVGYEDVITDTEPVSIRDLARRAWAGVETTNATLDLGDDAILEIDKVLGREALEHLFRNALEHGRSGEDEAITVTVRATDTGFLVDDDGVGIPEPDRERVFEVGYTTSDDGTGLGLPIVAEIADAHGWTVTVDENDHGGARIVVDEPAATAAGDLAGERTATDEGESHRSGERPATDGDGTLETEETDGDGTDRDSVASQPHEQAALETPRPRLHR